MAKASKRKKPARKKTPSKQATYASLTPQLRPRPLKSGVAHIKVVGLGGGGGNVVSRMMEGDRMRGVEFIAVNTDAQDLNHTIAHHRIYIGKALTHGLGAGMNPEIGKQAAEENRSEIGEALHGADIIFLTAGLGGGTGTGAIPIVAEIAREKNILTVAIVTKPFTFEGAQRAAIAQEGLVRLKEKVDALVVIPNDRIFSVIDKDTPLLKAFGYIDDVLKNAVKAVSELINVPGIVNVDFADIAATLKDAGTTLIGIGIASGQDRSMKAVNAALSSPLLEVAIDGARGVLFSVAGGRDMKMSEIHEVAKAVSANLDQNARVIFGAYHDRSLRDKSIKVTVIATGFSGIFSGARLGEPSLFTVPDAPKQVPEPELHAKHRSSSVKDKQPKPPTEDSETWEIPTFLRKKRGK
ncbi:MAG: cell division protein FtsZ [Patescibacteria group bacterium]